MLCHFGIWFIIMMTTMSFRDVGYGWAGLATAHPGFGRSVNPISTRGGRLCPPTLLLAQPALGSFLRHCDFRARLTYYELNTYVRNVHVQNHFQYFCCPDIYSCYLLWVAICISQNSYNIERASQNLVCDFDRNLSNSNLNLRSEFQSMYHDNKTEFMVSISIQGQLSLLYHVFRS